ncbi:MAG: peptidylprolyl isomerase, partial [Cohnella sp.]|nr:peptidylprolyl isomerase [Cohnella sp.]
EQETSPPHAPDTETNRKSLINWTWIGVTLLALAALILVLVLGQHKSGMNDAVGRMDGVTITKADLYDEMVKQAGVDQVSSKLDGMLTLKLIDLEAKKVNAVVNPADIDAELAIFKKSYPSDAQFNAAMQQNNMTLDSLKQQIGIQLKLRKIFEPQIKPTDDQLKKYFDANKASFGTAEVVRASHILLATKAEADAVLAELKKGTDFATLAKEKSTDPGSKANGGDLDYFGRGAMNPQFETAAFNLKVGEMSGVVQSPNGFHIIKLTDKKPAFTPTYDQVKQQVKNRYVDEQLQTLITGWLDKEKKAYHVENLLAKPATTAPASATATTPAAPTPSASGQ